MIGIGFQISTQTSQCGILEKIKSSERIDICLSREFGRVTSDVDLTLGLIYTNIINAHDSREGQVLEVNSSEVFRHAQVHDKVLMRKAMR